jgi:hypothetical protein
MMETVSKRSVRVLAFYLPQFHPIPENDEWWGRGFTEWRSVVAARPQFRGHYQPHLPADLGFYDLRTSETREAQAALAREYGISGFCYYHYWFNGRRLLGRPFDEVLESGRPDFPFSLCWANEDWTRAWDGRSGERLIRHEYSDEDDRRHLQWLARAFQDERYIRVHGKPLFLVYRALRLPDPLRTTEIWREEAQRLGVGELFLCRVESFTDEHSDPAPLGFDAAVEFQPDWTRLGTPFRRGRHWNLLRKLGLSSPVYRRHRVYDYESVVQGMLEKRLPPYRCFPCVTPSWDNTPRRKSDAVVLRGSTPELYARWLSAAIEKELSSPPDEAMVFINAWNEWAEGNHLEPCQRWGPGYLEATRDALAATRAGDRRSTRVVPVKTGHDRHDRGAISVPAAKGSADQASGVSGGSSMFDSLIWRDDRMLLDNLVFRLELAKSDDWDLGEDCFRLYKTKSLVDQYARYWSGNNGFEAKNILELGIWDGGSVAFWFEFFHPEKHVAVDILERTDSDYFQRYKSSRGLERTIRTYWGTNQSDSDALRRIIQNEFSGELDLVIDDASHIYEPTKASFETVFPLLRPGGLYIMEDWGWEYWESYYASGNPLSSERGLTKLVLELMGATASSTDLISSLSIFQGFVAVERGRLDLSVQSKFQIERFLSRRPPLSRLRARLARELRRESRRTRSILMRISRRSRRVLVGFLR